MNPYRIGQRTVSLTEARDTPNPNFSQAMFVASMAASTSFIVIPQLPSATPRHRPRPPSAISPSPSSSLSFNSRSSFLGGSFSGEELKLSGRTKSGDNSRRGYGFVTMAIDDDEFDLSGNGPPDMPSVVLNERIIYIGEPLTFEVAESIFTQLICLWERSMDKPIYMYINSTGSTTVHPITGQERNAFALYDLMTCSPAPIYTLCVGHAWGEAALLLASGEPGHRAALPSATIMMTEPTIRLPPTSDLGLIMKDMAQTKASLVELYAKSTRKSPEQIEADMEIPKYFSPEEAVEYGIIDRVIRSEKNQEDKELSSWLKTAKLVEQL
ncbi:ATP-dependent Clp protease proteolytic subunit-related protein [Drosera capensis]